MGVASACVTLMGGGGVEYLRQVGSVGGAVSKGSPAYSAVQSWSRAGVYVYV